MNEKEKILWNIAEIGASYMESAAKSQSRNKNLPDDYREKYTTMANKFGEMKNTFHKYKERDKNTSNQIDETPDYIGCVSGFDKNEYTEKNKKIYFDSEKEEEQLLNASSNLDVGSFTLSQWEGRWVELGKLSMIELDEEEFNCIGLIKLMCGTEVVYIVRAIELGNGGIIKKLREIKNLSGKKSSTIYRNIKEKYNYISVDILRVGNEEVAINVCRNLERQLIEKYNPKWLQQEDI